MYSFLDEIKRRMNDSNFFWKIFQFRSLRIRFFNVVNVFWYSFIASFRILRVDCKFEYVFFIIFFNVCVFARSKVETVRDCSFLETIDNFFVVFLIRTERKCWWSFFNFILWIFNDTRKYRRRTDTTEKWTFNLFKIWTIWRKLLIVWNVDRSWFCWSVVHSLLN